MLQRAQFFLGVLPSIVACSPADDGEPGDLDGEVYVAATWVEDVDSANTYVALVDSLDIEELDFAAAIEVPGWADAWVYDDWVFIADGEAPNVSRYALTDHGQLELDGRIGFANTGVAGAAFWDNQILSPTKAYLSNVGNREYEVWNPTTMEITGTVSWPELPFDEGLDPFNSYTDRGGVVADGLFFHGFYGTDFNFASFGDRSYVAVYDIETDALLETIEVPCPMMDVASLGDDGFVYVSGWSYMPLSYEAGYTATNCAARIDVSTRLLDPDWSLDYADATGGDQGSALRAIDGDEGIFAAFHGSGVPVVAGMDMWELDAGADDWELYDIDLETREASPTGLTMGDGSYYESHIGDRYFVYLGDIADTQVYERTPTGYEPRFVAKGWMSRLFQLR